MALHCPGWILCIFCANTARETLLYSAPINTIVKKYSTAIEEHYSEISNDFIQVCAEKMLASLVEVDAGSAAEEIIRGDMHKKIGVCHFYLRDKRTWSGQLNTTDLHYQFYSVFQKPHNSFSGPLFDHLNPLKQSVSYECILKNL